MEKNKDQKTILPTWAPRIPQGKIRRLYTLDSLGIHDDELIDEIGFGLLARCQSFLLANQASSGQLPCPVCGTIIHHQMTAKEILLCPQCNWQTSWKDYFATIQHKQLSGAEPVLVYFKEYIEKFPLAHSATEKMFLIDRLLHGFHYYGKTPTRPVAINLIEGRLGEVMDFLDELSYTENSTPGLQQHREEWEVKIQNARSWGKKKS
jgi:hypothetical protein